MSDFVKAIEEPLRKLAEIKCDVICRAVDCMCEHYQCSSTDLTLEHTENQHQILRKEVPGLAYLIRYVTDDTAATQEHKMRVVAEPIYLESGK